MMNRAELLDMAMSLPVWCACHCHGAEVGGLASTSDPVAAALACAPCLNAHVAALIEWPAATPRAHFADATAWCDQEDGC